MYIEPVALVRSNNGEVLLAGTPNYFWAQDREGKIEHVRRDSIFGVIIGADGRARIVPAPVDARRVVGIRVAARADGSWVFAFAERAHPGNPNSDTIPVIRLWSGVYTGTRWQSLEPLPMPVEGQMDPLNASVLVPAADTLAWAMKIKTPDLWSRVVLFERRGGRWTYEIVPAELAVYVSLLHTDNLGYLLAIVQPDRSTTDKNSLFLFARREGWKSLRRVIFGAQDGPAHSPALFRDATGTELTWLAEVRSGIGSRMELRTMRGKLEERNGRTVVLNSSSMWNFAALTMGDGTRLWVTEHLLPGDSIQREMRFVRDSAGTASVVGRFTAPFVGMLVALPETSSEMLLAGGMIEAVTGNRAPRSLLVRTRLECPGGRS